MILGLGIMVNSIYLHCPRCTSMEHVFCDIRVYTVHAHSDLLLYSHEILDDLIYTSLVSACCQIGTKTP